MRPGIKSASSWILIRFISTESQWEFLNFFLFLLTLNLYSLFQEEEEEEEDIDHLVKLHRQKLARSSMRSGSSMVSCSSSVAIDMLGYWEGRKDLPSAESGSGEILVTLSK